MIKKLTDAQKDQFAVYREEGIAAGLSTKPVDRNVAKEFGKKLCKFFVRPYKATIVVDGPYHAFFTTVVFAQMSLDPKDVPVSPKGEVLNKDMKRLLKQVKTQLREQGVPVPKNLKNLFHSTIQAINKNEISYVYPYMEGQIFSFSVYFYRYFRDVLGIKYDVDFELLEDSINFGLIYPLESGIVVISDRLKEISRKDDVLHCDKGPAWEYRDGSKGWNLNGVNVPQWLAETPAEQLDPLEFAKIDNVEVRREFVRKLGVERLIQKLGAKEIDKEGDYSVLEVDLGDQVGAWRYLKMLNPSLGVWHMECVGRDCSTVRDAINFRASRLKSLKKDWKPEELT